MKVADFMRQRGVLPSRYLFMATNKTFGFGGDASRQADWSVRLPVYINGKSGYMECFVVDGSTRLLVGRPIPAGPPSFVASVQYSGHLATRRISLDF